MSPRISILLPVWNAEETLDLCLRSCLRQRERDWECIVIDDGSTDRSLEIARGFAKQDRRFHVHAGPHKGLIGTLNAGIAFCTAPVVARMDADDWMHQDRLRRQVEALEKHPELEAVGSFVRIFPRKTMRQRRREYETWLRSQIDAETIWRDRFIECPIPHPSLAIRKSALDQLGYRDRHWPEDYDLLLRLLRKGPCVGIVASRLLGWRDRPDRLSRTDARYAQDRFTACRAWHLHRDFLGSETSYVLWGHGKTGRALRRELAELGHEVSFIVDVHPRRIGERIGGALVLSPDELAERLGLASSLPKIPERTTPVVVSVSGLGPRTQIRAALEAIGLQEGKHFVCAA